MASSERQGKDGLGPCHESAPVERLTCIHERIHYTATRDTTDEGNDLDQMQIQNFLSTLAEVAMAVAKRKEHLGQ